MLIHLDPTKGYPTTGIARKSPGDRSQQSCECSNLVFCFQKPKLVPFQRESIPEFLGIPSDFSDAVDRGNFDRRGDDRGGDQGRGVIQGEKARCEQFHVGVSNPRSGKVPC